jgi:hypothetical protein
MNSPTTSLRWKSEFSIFTGLKIRSAKNRSSDWPDVTPTSLPRTFIENE